MTLLPWDLSSGRWAPAVTGRPSRVGRYAPMRLNRALWLLFGLLCAACDSSKPRADFSPFHGIY